MRMPVNHGNFALKTPKDGICLLGSRPIYQKQRIIIFKHRDETGVSKILRKFKGDNVFLGCVVYLDSVY